LLSLMLIIAAAAACDAFLPLRARAASADDISLADIYVFTLAFSAPDAAAAACCFHAIRYYTPPPPQITPLLFDIAFRSDLRYADFASQAPLLLRRVTPRRLRQRFAQLPSAFSHYDA
jgi:hypothetical protein